MKGISHHAVAERLGVWLTECVGRTVTLVLEAAEENEIGVECVAVYDVDEHLGYIDDNQKHELLVVLRRKGKRTLRSRIVGYDPGRGAEHGWSHARLVIEAPRLRQGDKAVAEAAAEALRQVPQSPWKGWSYEGPLLPRTQTTKKLDTVLTVLAEMIEEEEPWSDVASHYVAAFCRHAYIDLSAEMRLETLRLLTWLSRGEGEMLKWHDTVLAVMNNMMSDEVRGLIVRLLIDDRASSAACHAMVESSRLDMDYLNSCFEAMPYKIDWSSNDLTEKKRFVAKLYYDSTLSRKQLEQVYTVLAVRKCCWLEGEKQRGTAVADTEVNWIRRQHEHLLELLVGKMDKDMGKHTANGDVTCATVPAEDARRANDSGDDAMHPEEELFVFVHPEVDDAEEAMIHRQVKRLVRHFGMKEICDYLYDMAKAKKILLPQRVNAIYDELVRMGMPTGEGYAQKTFEKYYKR